MALFLPSLFPLFRLFLSFRRAYIYTHIYRSVLPSLVSSLFTLAALLSVRISNNTQATLAPLFAAAAHEYARENIDQPSFPATPLAPSPSVHPPMPTFSYQPPIPSRRFFISESPAVAVSSIPAGVEEQFSFRHAAEYWLERASANPFLLRFLHFPSSLARIGIYSPIRLGSLFERGICKFCCWINLKNDEDS